MTFQGLGSDPAQTWGRHVIQVYEWQLSSQELKYRTRHDILVISRDVWLFPGHYHQPYRMGNVNRLWNLLFPQYGPWWHIPPKTHFFNIGIDSYDVSVTFLYKNIRPCHIRHGSTDISQFNRNGISVMNLMNINNNNDDDND